MPLSLLIVLPDIFGNSLLLAPFAFAWLSFTANIFNSTLILDLSGCVPLYLNRTILADDRVKIQMPIRLSQTLLPLFEYMRIWELAASLRQSYVGKVKQYRQLREQVTKQAFVASLTKQAIVGRTWLRVFELLGCALAVYFGSKTRCLFIYLNGYSGERRRVFILVNSPDLPSALLKFKTFSYRAPQFGISFSQILNHPLLDCFINVHKVGDEVI